MNRVPIWRVLDDGTVEDGTARATLTDKEDGLRLDDFRDLDGNDMNLPPGASFVIPMEEP